MNELENLLYLLNNIEVSGKKNLNNLLAAIQTVEKMAMPKVDISEVLKDD